MLWDCGIVLIYVLFLVAVSLRGGRSVRSASDFVSGGKTYGTAVLFASLTASFIGGGYSSGNAAAAYETGIGTAAALCGFGIGQILIGWLLVPGVARFPRAVTVGGVLGEAYGTRVRVVAGMFSFLCCAGVVGAQLESIGLVFQCLFGISRPLGTVLGCAVVLLYTTFGGLQSVIVADVIQFLLLAVGMPSLLVLAVRGGGGVVSLAAALPRELFSPVNGSSPAAWISLFFSLMCGEALAPPYMQRLLIGKTPRSTARATVAGGLFSLPFFAVTCAIGLTARALNVATSPATAMPDLIVAVLPVGVRGLLMAAMTSIMLSAADGFLNGAAVGAYCDTVSVIRPHLSERQGLRWLRTVNLLTGLGALVLSLAVPDVFSILLLAYAVWSPTLLVPLSAALLGVQRSERTVLCAVGAGLGVCLLWNTALGKPWEIDGCLPGILANAAVFCLPACRSLTSRRQ